MRAHRESHAQSTSPEALPRAGAFTWDPSRSEIIGPSSYMQSARFDQRIEQIRAGRDAVFNFGLDQHGNAATGPVGAAIMTDLVASPIREPFAIPVQVTEKLWARIQPTEKRNSDRNLRDVLTTAYGAVQAAPNSTVVRFSARAGDKPERMKLVRDPLEGVIIGFATDELALSEAARTVAAGDKLLELDRIEPNPAQPRKLFDPAALDELATSIRQHGLLQPLVVRETEYEHYQIIAGERRWRAAQLAGLVRVPCRVLRNITDEDAFVLSVSENVARRDMTIVEEAKAYSYIVSLGRSREDVAKLFGKTPEHVGYRMDLLRLRDDLQELAARGQLSKNMAWYVSRLSANGQAQVTREYLRGAFRDDDAACRYAAAVYQVEQQGALELGDRPETDPLLTAAADATRRTVKTAWGKLHGLAKLLDGLAELSPQEIATALGPDTAVYSEGMDLILRQVSKARSLVNQAYALHQARQAVAGVA